MRRFAKGRKIYRALAFGLGLFAALVVGVAQPAWAAKEHAESAGRDATVGRGVVYVAAQPGGAGSKPKPSKGKDKSTSKNRSDESNERTKTPTTFAEAFERGEQALDESEAAKVALLIAKDQKTFDKDLLSKLQSDKVQADQQAIDDLRLALLLAVKASGKDRPEVDDLNKARYHLSYLYFGTGKYYEAAVLGDYLARRATDKTEGREGAKITLGAFIEIFKASKQPDKSFEIGKIRETAEFMLVHWPAEADDAAFTLLNFALAERKVDDALAYLNRIPETSPQRGQSDLRAGKALWDSYLEAIRLPADKRPAPEDLERLKTEGRRVLQEGIERTKDAPEANRAIADAMLALAQIYVDAGEREKAISTLEDPKFGPLTLLAAGNSAVGQTHFAIETYKVAVRAYIANHQVDKTKTVMDALDKVVVESGEPGAEQMLTEIYSSLGRELQQQMERLRKQGTKAELDAVSDAFETFLTRIGSRKGGSDVNSLAWAAESAYGLASNLDDPNGPAGDRAKAYYKQAATAYAQILEQAAKDPAKFPDLNTDALVGIRLRMAVSLRRLGQYDEALKQIGAVLKDRPSMLTAQVAGADTLMAQGEVDKDGYARAIKGGLPDKKGENLIWGWGRLARATQGNSKFEETFYYARLKLAEARLLFALKWSKPDERDKVLDQARDDLWMTYRYYETLGGAETAAKFDILLKRIQSQLHQPIVGLREFKERKPAG